MNHLIHSFLIPSTIIKLGSGFRPCIHFGMIQGQAPFHFIILFLKLCVDYRKKRDFSFLYDIDQSDLYALHLNTIVNKNLPEAPELIQPDYKLRMPAIP